MKRRSQVARIRRLRNRIKRIRDRLRGCDEARQDARRHNSLRRLAERCDVDGLDFDELVDEVADQLDAWIEPRNPVREWISDIGIDVAAYVAVALYRDTEARLRRRLARLEAQLTKLEAER